MIGGEHSAHLWLVQGAGLASMEMMTRGMNLETMPVLRHGPVLAHILDAAITCNGPSDPRLFTLLENDEMARVNIKFIQSNFEEMFCLFDFLQFQIRHKCSN